MAIAEIPFGFVFLSDTFFGGVPAPALTSIDCFGNVQWSQVYVPAAGLGLNGLDLIRTRTRVGGGRFELAVAETFPIPGRSAPELTASAEVRRPPRVAGPSSSPLARTAVSARLPEKIAKNQSTPTRTAS